MARKSEMMEAIEALAKAKDISVDQIMEAVEDGLKAAYRREMTTDRFMGALALRFTYRR